MDDKKRRSRTMTKLKAKYIPFLRGYAIKQSSWVVLLGRFRPEISSLHAKLPVLRDIELRYELFSFKPRKKEIYLA
jgi:hypothetical protein